MSINNVNIRIKAANSVLDRKLNRACLQIVVSGVLLAFALAGAITCFSLLLKYNFHTLGAVGLGGGALVGIVAGFASYYFFKTGVDKLDSLPGRIKKLKPSQFDKWKQGKQTFRATSQDEIKAKAAAVSAFEQAHLSKS